MRSGTEVANMELTGGTDLGMGRARGRRMEHHCDGRHDFGSELPSACRVGLAVHGAGGRRGCERGQRE
jgi:hypothetical protein